MNMTYYERGDGTDPDDIVSMQCVICKVTTLQAVGSYGGTIGPDGSQFVVCTCLSCKSEWRRRWSTVEVRQQVAPVTRVPPSFKGRAPSEHALRGT